MPGQLSLDCCCFVAIAVVEHASQVIKGLLTSKSSIFKKHVHSKTRTGKRQNGCEHGKEYIQGTKQVTHYVCENLHGQYGGALLDNQPC